MTNASRFSSGVVGGRQQSGIWTYLPPTAQVFKHLKEFNNPIKSVAEAAMECKI